MLGRESTKQAGEKRRASRAGKERKKTSQARLAQEHDWFWPMANIEGRSP
jgi:hypothetical protein